MLLIFRAIIIMAAGLTFYASQHLLHNARLLVCTHIHACMHHQHPVHSHTTFPLPAPLQMSDDGRCLPNC